MKPIDDMEYWDNCDKCGTICEALEPCPSCDPRIIKNLDKALEAIQNRFNGKHRAKSKKGRESNSRP